MKPLVLMGWILAIVSPALAQPAASVEPLAPTVVMQGEGIVRRAPDQALVRVGAESRASVPQEAQAATAAAMTAVQSRLAKAGVPREALRTIVVSLQQEFDYKDGRQTPRGYLARNVIEVRVDDLTTLGEVLDASVGAGATSVQGLEFGLKERALAEREALTRAVTDAVARAEAAASGVRRTVDRIVKIEEAVTVAPMRQQAFMATDAARGAATPVAEGEIEIRARVTVTATLK